MTESNVFVTQNLYQGAYCLCRGFKLAGKKREGQKVFVAFEGKNVQEEALKFYNGGAKVEAKDLTDAYRTLKDYIFER